MTSDNYNTNEDGPMPTAVQHEQYWAIEIAKKCHGEMATAKCPPEDILH